MTALKTLLAAGALSLSALMPASTAEAANEKFREVLDRGTLRVGVLGAFKPWAYRAPDGSLEGIEIDLAQSVADALGVTLEPVVVTSANRIEFLQQGRIDLIIGGMYDTAERREVVGIVEPAYWSSGPTLMSKKGVIDDWEDIRGKPVCGKQGVYYNNLVERQYDVTMVAFTGNAESKEALRAGRCIAWLYDDVSIMADLEDPEWAEYDMPLPVLFDNPWGAAVPIEEKDSAWGVFMSGMAYRWHAEGKLMELERKWGVRPSDWLAAQHEALTWERAYLEPK